MDGVIETKSPIVVTPSGNPQVVKTQESVNNEPKTNVIETPVITSNDDLLKRVTKPSEEKTKEESFYNSSDIDKLIKDPVQNKILKDIYKSMESGLNKKFTQLSEDRKKFESQSNTWNRERIQSELKNPNFIQAAQELMREQQFQSTPSSFEGTQEEWSALSDSDKKAFMNLENKLNNFIASQERNLLEQSDREIKTRFQDYEPSKVDTFQQDIIHNRISPGQIRELIWKATNFDRYLNQAYRFGQEDRQGNLKEKLSGATMETGSSVQVSDERPARLEGESSQTWLKRIMDWNYKREINKRANL